MAAARSSQGTGQNAERAVLVAVEFTGERRKLRLPQSEGAILAALEAGAVLEKKRFEGNLAYVTARGPASLLNRFRRFRERA
ncbi:MAG TPA: hypothetical protein VGU67_14065 [Edaphobacter sp.]|nr:hypothetical protein [Edaphobacter sp.]